MTALLLGVIAPHLVAASIGFAVVGMDARRRLHHVAPAPITRPAPQLAAPSAGYPSHTRILVMR